MLIQFDCIHACQSRHTSSLLATMLTAVVVRLTSPLLMTTIATKKLRSSSIIFNCKLKPKNPLIPYPLQHPLPLLFQPSRPLIQVPVVFSLWGHSHCSSLYPQRYGSPIGFHLQDATGDRSQPGSQISSRCICLLLARIAVVDYMSVADH